MDKQLSTADEQRDENFVKVDKNCVKVDTNYSPLLLGVSFGSLALCVAVLMQNAQIGLLQESVAALNEQENLNLSLSATPVPSSLQTKVSELEGAHSDAVAAIDTLTGGLVSKVSELEGALSELEGAHSELQGDLSDALAAIDTLQKQQTIVDHFYTNPENITTSGETCYSFNASAGQTLHFAAQVNTQWNGEIEHIYIKIARNGKSMRSYDSTGRGDNKPLRQSSQTSLIFSEKLETDAEYKVCFGNYNGPTYTIQARHLQYTYQLYGEAHNWIA